MREEQMRATIRKLQTDINDLLAEQERNVRLIFRRVGEQLDRIHRMASSGTDGVSDRGNCLPYSSSAELIASAFPGSAADGHFSGAVGGVALGVASTPMSDRVQSMQPGAQNNPIDAMPRSDCSQWGSLGPYVIQETSPSKSSQKQWCDDPQARNAMNTTVNYTCFEPLDSLGEDDLHHGADESSLSPCVYGDDVKYDQQFHHDDQGLRVTKPDVIHVGTFSSLSNQHVTTSVRVEYVNGRPKAVPIPEGVPEDPEKLGIDIHSRCKVMVEFKRKRVLQFESKQYVHPGSCVVVGGDRGEDIGLVTYTWCETARKLNGGVDCSYVSDAAGGGLGGKSVVVGIALAGSTFMRHIGLGSGTVLRLAEESDVNQLHTVQVELERRAIDVCSQRVLERGLPMTIVDAEYQFDKNKLTFFYEAQQRMDFRELVRDLYKTFRARIWMEVVENQ
uniref:Uncharacterized protein TCIL3000_10_8450 n=1 Tax=Trypanosoma congolense (strain IL3000) TaxID=1068625 RepID=G0UXF2_TRYCI|nr:unnamed protein product [Trypanosoma congolense IL3000]